MTLSSHTHSCGELLRKLEFRLKWVLFEHLPPGGAASIPSEARGGPPTQYVLPGRMGHQLAIRSMCVVLAVSEGRENTKGMKAATVVLWSPIVSRHVPVAAGHRVESSSCVVVGARPK